MMKFATTSGLRWLVPVTAVTGLLTAPAWADGDGDGLPHIAVAQEGAGTPQDPFDFELEFKVFAGFADTDPPTLTVITPDFEPGGYVSRPFDPDDIPNADLGFVSEIEGVGENVVIQADIVVQLIEKDPNFRVTLTDEIFATNGSTLDLGNQFDEHPQWVLANSEGDFTPATALFEVFNTNEGSVGSPDASLGQFRIVLAVPEPTSLTLIGLSGLAMLGRRRRR